MFNYQAMRRFQELDEWLTSILNKRKMETKVHHTCIRGFCSSEYTSGLSINNEMESSCHCLPCHGMTGTAHTCRTVSTKRMASIRKYNPGKPSRLLQQVDESYTRGVSDRIAANPFFWFSDDLEQLPDKYHPKTGPSQHSATF